MTTAEGLAGSSSPSPVALGQALRLFGSVADYAAGAPIEQAGRIAGAAVAMGELAGLAQDQLDALYFAAHLRNLGALGNAGLAKGDLSERSRTMLRWDIPADGARICEKIRSLPQGTAEIVRWQSEHWDGTGFPDQLRWSSIPKAAQLLHIAQAFAGASDPEDALETIAAQSGRAFAPEEVRTFVMWFHTNGGEVAPAAEPASLAQTSGEVPGVLRLLAQRIDAHNGTPERSARIDAYARRLGERIGLHPKDRETLELACALFGAGEICAAHLEAQQFDPLARLGIESRAQHALACAELLSAFPEFFAVAQTVRARAEWYDGTGSPDGLRHDAIPRAAQVLALAIAFDAIDEAYRSRITEERTLPIDRLETAAGTQFEPELVRILGETIRDRA